MPLFDTQPLTFGWGQLFRDNRYLRRRPPGRRQPAHPGPQHAHDPPPTAASVLRAASARSAISTSSRVRIPGEPITADDGSAWVADANYAPTDRWTLGASYQWDPDSQRTDLSSVRARYRFGRRTACSTPATATARDLLGTDRPVVPVPDQPELEHGRPLLLLAARQQDPRDPGRLPVGQLLCRRSACRPPLRAQSAATSATALYLEIELKGLGCWPGHEARLAPCHPRLQSR